ncbi:MAG: CpsD/CapB family tyrosine-protein kinase [Phycisphaerae bacterium]
MREKGWDIAIAVVRNGRPPLPGATVPGVAPAVLPSLRSLWSAVFSTSERSRGYCLMVTAAKEGEGVSQIATGLALAGAGLCPDRRIVVVDFNFKRPMVGRLFRFPAVPGVADVLAGRLPIEEAPIQTQEMAIDVLPAGCANGGALLPFAWAAARQLIDRLRDEYDCILLDAPAVNGGDITAELGGLADGVLLVIKAGATRREAVMEARFRLERAGAWLVGAVLNG